MKEEGGDVNGHYTLSTHVDVSKINISEGEISALPHSYYIQIAHNYNVKLKKPPKHFFGLCVMLPPVKWVYLKQQQQQKYSITERDRNRDTDREKEKHL